jgi:hypothetical protein
MHRDRGLKVGDGRGFVVGNDDFRYAVTATSGSQANMKHQPVNVRTDVRQQRLPIRVKPSWPLPLERPAANPIVRSKYRLPRATSDAVRIQPIVTRIFIGHAASIMTIIPARSVDLIVTSPPYWTAVNAQVLCFLKGKTKFLRADGSIGKEPGNGIVLLGAGNVANDALRRSGLGACVVMDLSD